MTGYAKKLNDQTLKSSIHDLEAWLPLRKVTDSKSSVPTVCMISASPAPTNTAPEKPTATFADSDALRMLGSESALQIEATQTASLESFLDIPPLACETVFEKE